MIAALFPGQGSQQPGMLRALSALPCGEATVIEACEHLGRDLYADDGEEVMRSTAAAQRALLVAGVASARAIESVRVRIGAVAGHSVGAFAAAVACGALRFADALRVVDARGTAMAEAFTVGYGVAAISGLDEGEVEDVVRAARQTAKGGELSDGVYAANVNAPDQVLVAGRVVAVSRALQLARERGARTRWLPVAVPAHTALMQPVARHLARVLAPHDVHAASAYYATNASGRTVRDAERIRADLVESVARPVRWADAVSALYERGARLFVEACPGTVLSHLAARAFPEARSLALETAGLTTLATLARSL